MCKLQEEAMARNDEMTERRAPAVQVAGSVLTEIVRQLRNIAAEDVTPYFCTNVPKDLLRQAADALDTRATPASAPSVDRNSVLEEAIKACKSTRPTTNLLGDDELLRAWQCEQIEAALIDLKSEPLLVAAAPASPAAPTMPEGWKLVPIVPTDDMRDAPEVSVGGCYSCSAQQVSWGECAEIYAAMLDAAPVAQPLAPSGAVPTIADDGVFKDFLYQYSVAFVSDSEADEGYASSNAKRDRLIAYIDSFLPPQVAAQEVQGDAVTDEQRDRMRDGLSIALGEAMDCTRVWSAWRVGTMSERDFELLADNDERLDELVEAAVAAIAAPAQQPTDSAAGKIPAGIYYCAEHDNFYSFPFQIGMGQSFYEIWRERKSEFPAWPTDSAAPSGDEVVK